MAEKSKKIAVGVAEVWRLFRGEDRTEKDGSNVKIVEFISLPKINLSVYRIGRSGLRSGSLEGRPTNKFLWNRGIP